MASRVLVEPEVVAALRGKTVPVRVLLGHRIDPTHVTFFASARAFSKRYDVEHDPAFLLIAPDGKVLWKHVGLLDKATLLRALD